MSGHVTVRKKHTRHFQDHIGQDLLLLDICITLNVNLPQKCEDQQPLMNR